MHEPCDHQRSYWKSGGTDAWSGEALPDVQVVEATYEDMDVGRFRCTQCGKVMYYTGQWQDYFENGTPCPGSDAYEKAVKLENTAHLSHAGDPRMTVPAKAALVARIEAQLCERYPHFKGAYDSKHWRVGVIQSDIHTARGLAFTRGEYVLFRVTEHPVEQPVLAFSFLNSIDTGLHFNDIREVEPPASTEAPDETKEPKAPLASRDGEGLVEEQLQWEDVRHKLALAIMGFALPGRPGGQSVASAERMLDALSEEEGPMPYLRKIRTAK